MGRKKVCRANEISSSIDFLKRTRLQEFTKFSLLLQKREMISMVREISPFLFDLGYTWWREMLNMGSRGRSNTFELFGFGFLSLLMDLVLELD